MRLRAIWRHTRLQAEQIPNFHKLATFVIHVKQKHLNIFLQACILEYLSCLETTLRLMKLTTLWVSSVNKDQTIFVTLIEIPGPSVIRCSI
jgi:hypothetical protein